jgi:hypothetical protein
VRRGRLHWHLRHSDGAPRWSRVCPISQEKWSDRRRDRSFNKAWGDSSPLELGRVMPKDCWVRCKGPLITSKAESCVVTCSSTMSAPCGGTRWETLRARGAHLLGLRPNFAPHVYQLGARAPTTRNGVPPRWAAPWRASRRSWEPAGPSTGPSPLPNVAPNPRRREQRPALLNRALPARDGHTYEVPRNRRCRSEQPWERPRPTSGTGAPALNFVVGCA